MAEEINLELATLTGRGGMSEEEGYVSAVGDTPSQISPSGSATTLSSIATASDTTLPPPLISPPPSPNHPRGPSTQNRTPTPPPTWTETLRGLAGFPSEKCWILWTLFCAVGSIEIATVLLVKVPNSIRNELEFESKQKKWLLNTVALITGGIYPTSLIVVAVIAYYKNDAYVCCCPKPLWMMHPRWKKVGDWFRRRLVRWGMDVLFLVLCAYLGLVLTDWISLLISYTYCIHLLPMANLLGLTENIGLFDGILSISLGATLARMEGHIIVRVFAVLLICALFQGVKHANEFCRYVRKTNEAAANVEDDIERGIGREQDRSTRISENTPLIQ